VGDGEPVLDAAADSDWPWEPVAEAELFADAEDPILSSNYIIVERRADSAC
jgi:hypothetical protein